MAALVLVNGKIVTVDEQFAIREAVAIEGGGSPPWATTRLSWRERRPTPG